MRLAGEKVVRASRACQGETSEISIKTNGCSLTQLCCACHIHSRGQMAYHLAERHAPAPPASTEESGLSGGLSQFHLQPESEMWKRTHFPNLRSSPSPNHYERLGRGYRQRSQCALSVLVSGSSMNSRTSISNTGSWSGTVLYLATSMALSKPVDVIA
jgi:hypothetical protein